MNGNQEIEFRNGDKMKKVEKAKYRGCILTKKACTNTEIQAIISDHTSSYLTRPAMEENRLHHQLEIIDLPGGNHQQTPVRTRNPNC